MDPHAVTDLAALEALYAEPSALVRNKVAARLDGPTRAFMAASPFVLLATCGAEGPHLTPRGDGPGFVEALDDATLALPDRRGNNRLDTIRNLLGGPGQVGLMFLIPGFEDVYRINGRAAATADEAVLAEHVEFGKPPVLVLVIDVEEAFFHCPKAIMRARLWEADAQVDRGVLPTLSEMVMDQLGLGKPTVSEDQIRASYETQL